jgi:hypothetical protein
MDNQFELPKEGLRIYNPDSGWQSGPGAKAYSEDKDRQQGQKDADDASDASDEQEDETEFEAEAEQEASAAQRESRESLESLVHPESAASEPVLQDEASPAPEIVAPEPEPEPLLAAAAPVTGPAPSLRGRRASKTKAYTARSQGAVDAYPKSDPVVQEITPPSGAEFAAALVPQTQAAALAKVGDSLESLFSAIQRSTVSQVVEGNAPSWRDVADISRQLEERLNNRQALLKELRSVDQEIRETRQDLLYTLNALSEYEQQNLQAASMRASISSVAAQVIAKRFAESGEGESGLVR